MKNIQTPPHGEIILMKEGKVLTPNQPIIPFIEGDGIGQDITPVMKKVVDEAVKKAYGQERKIAWMEIFAGEKATQIYGKNHFLPQETLEALKKYTIAIKGPLGTPVGGGIRSINVSLRQQLDLYICKRPVRYFKGSPSPLKAPEKTDMVIFRENSEDIYAGIEWEAGSKESEKMIRFLKEELHVTNLRFEKDLALGLKPISKEGSSRLIQAAIEYALAEKKESVTLVHKGNIMKFTEGAFKKWGYEIAKNQFNAQPTEDGEWMSIEREGAKPLIIKDVIADNFLQQILIRPEDYDVVATMNLNGDYISDALAASVGGLGIAPGANIGDYGAIFEATHGTAPKHQGLNEANPSSLILSGSMMLDFMGWSEASMLIEKGLEQSIQDQKVTYDFARLINKAPLSCSEFGDAIVKRM